MRDSKYQRGSLLAACCAVFCLLPFVRMAAGEASLNLMATSQGEARAPLSPYHFIVGEQLVYRVSYSGSARADFQALFADKNQTADQARSKPSGLAQSFRTSMQGKLLISVVDVREHDVVLAYNLHNVVVQLIVNGQENGGDEEIIKRELGRNIFAVLNLQGKVLSVRFDSAMSQHSKRFARVLFGATQFVFPGEASTEPDQWETQEEDPNGQYVAHYERVNRRTAKAGDPGRGSITFQKTIRRYLPADTKPSPTELKIETTITPAGSLLATFDQNNGRVTALNGTESQTIDVSGRTVAQARSMIGLRYIGTEALGSSRLAALRAANSQLERTAAAIPLSAAVSEAESESSIQRTELGADNLETLLTSLAKLESTPGDKNETPVYLKFKALIYVHPEASATLGQILSTADVNSLTMRVLTEALSAISNPEAQAALVGAIKSRPADWQALAMLIPALNAAVAPTPLAEETIGELASQSPNPNIASTARLTLGAMARNLAGTSPERAAKIVASFVEQIDSSSSDDRTRLLLLALGNTGSAQAYSTIAKFTTASSPALRAAAAWALRWVDFDQADAQLIKVITSDPDSNVRLEAANAFGFRQINSGSFEAQKQALATDKDEKVRLALLSNLWKGRAVFPEARKLVEKAAASDASEDVRKVATELLATDQTHLD